MRVRKGNQLVMVFLVVQVEERKAVWARWVAAEEAGRRAPPNNIRSTTSPYVLGAAIPKTPHPTHAHKMIMGSCLLFCR